MTTPNAVQRLIRELLGELFQRGLVILPSSIVASEDGVVTWRSPTPVDGFVDFAEYATLRTYRRWAESGEYSALMHDGSLLQMQYTISNGSIAAHRLAYVPCPFPVDRDLLLTDPVGDVLDLHDMEDRDTIRMQSMIRFDFDPAAAGESHPAAHLTLNVSGCRIACESPMWPEDFIRFVFRNFYEQDWRTHEAFFAALPNKYHDATVTEDERSRPHVAWRRR